MGNTIVDSRGRLVGFRHSDGYVYFDGKIVQGPDKGMLKFNSDGSFREISLSGRPTSRYPACDDEGGNYRSL